MSDRARASAHLGMLLTTLIWGGNFTISKLALREIPPLPFTAIRFLVGSVVFLFLLWRLGRLRWPPAGLGWPLIILGVIGNTLYQLCFIEGLFRTSATDASLILASLPTIVTVSAALLGLEQTTARQRWGVLLATVGVVAIVLRNGVGPGGGDLVGDLLMLAATGCWTIYSLGLRRISGSMPALELTAWTLFTGTPGLLLLGVPGMAALDWGGVSVPGWIAVAYAALLSLTAAYFLWSRSIQALGAGRTAIYSCGVPLVAATVALFLLGEAPTVAHAIGATLIIAGVLLSNRAIRSPIPPAE